MKIKGGELIGFSASPSGQLVAHVHTDSDRKFIMPFGHDAEMPDIIRAIEEEINTHHGVANRAAELHALVVPSLGSLSQKPNIPWYRKTWLALSWYFRRSK